MHILLQNFRQEAWILSDPLKKLLRNVKNAIFGRKSKKYWTIRKLFDLPPQEMENFSGMDRKKSDTKNFEILFSFPSRMGPLDSPLTSWIINRSEIEIKKQRVS